MLLIVSDLAVCFIAIIFGGYLPLFFADSICRKPEPVRVRENRGRRRAF